MGSERGSIGFVEGQLLEHEPHAAGAGALGLGGKLGHGCVAVALSAVGRLGGLGRLICLGGFRGLGGGGDCLGIGYLCEESGGGDGIGGNGTAVLEIITYHALALGFIASTLKPSGSVINKKRTAEIFNTGVTTVSTYLLQGICGMLISMGAAMIVKDFFPAAGLLLPFGYGQGTGQALNYGGIYE